MWLIDTFFNRKIEGESSIDSLLDYVNSLEELIEAVNDELTFNSNVKINDSLYIYDSVNDGWSLFAYDDGNGNVGSDANINFEGDINLNAQTNFNSSDVNFNAGSFKLDGFVLEKDDNDDIVWDGKVLATTNYVGANATKLYKHSVSCYDVNQAELYIYFLSNSATPITAFDNSMLSNIIVTKVNWDSEDVLFYSLDANRIYVIYTDGSFDTIDGPFTQITDSVSAY